MNGIEHREKISVIVPVYKVEKYLKRCIDSIINQTYKNLEIILVDDGSPDNCGNICDEYAKIDNRIKTLHKENGGLSSARNAGLNICEGEYVSFVDSDDCVSIFFYETMINAIKDAEADIAECRRIDIYDENQPRSVRPISPEVTIYNRNKAMELLIDNKILYQTVWDKLYKRDVILGIMFEEGKQHEDEYYTWQVFAKCKKIVWIDAELYYYYHRSGSIMEQEFSIKRLHAIEGRMDRHKYITEKMPELTLNSKISIGMPCICMMQQCLNTHDKSLIKMTKPLLESYIKTIDFTIQDLKNMDAKTRIWAVLSNISIVFCARIRSVLDSRRTINDKK